MVAATVFPRAIGFICWAIAPMLPTNPLERKPGKRMRELFDQLAGNSPLDPEEAVPRTTRTPQRKRFYEKATIAEADGGHAILLDGRPIRSPSGKQVIVPSQAIAEAVASEWNAQ